jgi:hypothetical protein
VVSIPPQTVNAMKKLGSLKREAHLANCKGESSVSHDRSAVFHLQPATSLCIFLRPVRLPLCAGDPGGSTHTVTRIRR